MPTIAVAVCLDRLAPALPEALAAVGREVADPVVAAAGLTAAEVVAVRQMTARTVPDARVVEADPGIAQARNASLAATDADVLVLLDDDVAHRPAGWPGYTPPGTPPPTTAPSSAARSRCASTARARAGWPTACCRRSRRSTTAPSRSCSTPRSARCARATSAFAPRRCARRAASGRRWRASATGSRSSTWPSASWTPPAGRWSTGRSWGSSGSSGSMPSSAATWPHRGCATGGARSWSERRATWAAR